MFFLVAFGGRWRGVLLLFSRSVCVCECWAACAPRRPRSEITHHKSGALPGGFARMIDVCVGNFISAEVFVLVLVYLRAASARL